MQPHVLVYTTPGCPDCAALKRWLQERGVDYEERDLSQPGVADEAKTRCGVRIAPVTIIGDRCFYGTFPRQRPKLEEALG